ncbi:Werner Syndrome-like exonuclease [Hondaea fermentalgiana]|uniref:Werner Syndrome-like exonuclease n=1 Tax=Hondaea fermentalgiana TaxID=2315210 RepID=A0A2R5GCD1_9STRA|nr:Werner Syndrome-like exonuclease [Hondaea fermentalgiana]|eukprot:GBG27999.1 Werner Syndrome-like exonuclease [Hondaea fermentalgiana]
MAQTSASAASAASTSGPSEALQMALVQLRKAEWSDEEAVRKAARATLAALRDVGCKGDKTSKSKATKKASATQWMNRREALRVGLEQLVQEELVKTVVLFEEIADSPAFQELLFVCLDAMSRALQRATSGRAETLDENASVRALALCDRLLERRRQVYIAEDAEGIRDSLSAISVLRIMQVYRVRVSHASGAETATCAVARFYRLMERRTEMKKNVWERETSFAVKELTELIVQFDLVRDASWPVDGADLVRCCVELHWFQLMSKLVAADSTKDLARVFIRTALSMKPPNMWKAHGCMKEYRLEREFPELVQAFRRGSLETCAEKGKHAELLFRLENYRDPKLTAFVTGLLVDQGEHWLAQHLADRLQLARNTPEFLRIDQETVKQIEQERQQTYLRLPHEIEASIVFVCTDASANMACAWLDGLGASDIVGMDGEWKASLKSGRNLASVLQLSSRERIFLLDLLWLMDAANKKKTTMGTHGSSSSRQLLCNALQRLFRREDVVKVAYGFSSDIDVLTKSYPGHTCWQAIYSLLDFAHVSVREEGSGQWAASYCRKVSRGLKDVVLQVLGKKLSKLEQLSNWEARPLRAGQMHYAALDAYVLTQIADAVFPPLQGIPSKLLTRLDHQAVRSRDGMRQHGASQMAAVAKGLEEMDLFKSAEAEMRRRCEQYGIRFVDSLESSNKVEGGEVRVIKLAAPMVAVKKVAEALGVGEAQVLKSMAYMVHEGAKSWKPVMVLVRGDSSVKEGQLAAWAQTMVRRASGDECQRCFGLPGGGLGPVSAVTPRFQVLCDSAVKEVSGPVYAGLGSLERIARYDSVNTLLKICGDARTSVAGVSSKAVTQQPTLRPISALETKFLVDNMLGRLGKIMRMVGLDCTKVQEVPGVEELLAASVANSQAAKVPTKEQTARKRAQSLLRTKELKLALAAARAEQRVFLTTDRKVAEMYREDDVVLLDNFSNRYAQFDEVCKRLAIKLDAGSFLTRCMMCNGLGFDRIDREEVARLKKEGHVSVDRVPDDILDSVTEFYRCKQPDCFRVFWEGPKFDHCWELYETLKLGEQRSASGPAAAETAAANNEVNSSTPSSAI